MKKKNKRERKQRNRREPWRVALVNLGCPKNTVDSETALGLLLESGFELAVEPVDADLVLINTCAFIAPAREESYAVIAEILAHKEEKPALKVAVMGCLTQREGTAVAERFPAIDALFGIDSYQNLPEMCRALLESNPGQIPVCGQVRTPATGASVEGTRLLTTPESYAYLRLAEGCDNLCSYCAIPLIRGHLRSRPEENILAEAAMLAENGAQELVLVAQDITAYGRETDGKSHLAQLLRKILDCTNDVWIRLLYAHPAGLDDQTIELLADEPRLCGYLDLPVQHINTRILHKMNRHYDRAKVESVLENIRKKLPSAVLRSTVIVGFPGETAKEFDELLQFVKAGHFQHLGAFGYSPEIGTKAAELGEMLPESEIEQRLDAVLLAQQENAFKWLDSRLGKTGEILVDRQLSQNLWEGRSVAEAPEVDNVILINSTKILSGRRIRACLTARDGYDIKAEPA